MVYSKCNLLVPEKLIKMTRKNIIIEQNKLQLMEILEVIHVFLFSLFLPDGITYDHYKSRFATC